MGPGTFTNSETSDKTKPSSGSDRASAAAHDEVTQMRRAGTIVSGTTNDSDTVHAMFGTPTIASG